MSVFETIGQLHDDDILTTTARIHFGYFALLFKFVNPAED